MSQGRCLVAEELCAVGPGKPPGVSQGPVGNVLGLATLTARL